MTALREAVARAIYAAKPTVRSYPGLGTSQVLTWEEVEQDRRDECLVYADATIAAVFAALREPTEKMLRAGRDANQTIFARGTDPAFIREIAEDTWRAMLTTAERTAATDSPPPATAAD